MQTTHYKRKALLFYFCLFLFCFILCVLCVLVCCCCLFCFLFLNEFKLYTLSSPALSLNLPGNLVLRGCKLIRLLALVPGSDIIPNYSVFPWLILSSLGTEAFLLMLFVVSNSLEIVDKGRKCYSTNLETGSVMNTCLSSFVTGIKAGVGAGSSTLPIQPVLKYSIDCNIYIQHSNSLGVTCSKIIIGP